MKVASDKVVSCIRRTMSPHSLIKRPEEDLNRPQLNRIHLHQPFVSDGLVHTVASYLGKYKDHFIFC